ncbi:MAG: hypothetical protein BHK79_00855 [Halanaerobium sp. MDAL1]|nr:MAG: hypothetical protein BHK79_00775 [Halanaerobium sp. MDAL1]OEG63820.1 MAG: hypothetical protein BHK79_00855 [Halanaerobium sp. MDAL1]
MRLMKIDLMIKNAKIIDGSGNPWFYGAVAVSDGKIAAVDRKENPEKQSKYRVAELVDAQNKFLSPGFIDVHSHSDFVFFIDPDAQSKLRQGITTEVIGNCGISGAPYNQRSADQVKSFTYGYQPDWRSPSEFLIALKEVEKTVNLCPLLGHGTLRAAVMGMENRAASASELKKMKGILREALHLGYRGMSTGLYFSPGNFAGEEELLELSRLLKKEGGVLTSHIRDEGVKTVGFLNAVKEILGFAEKTGVALEISHLKAFGPDVWGTSKKVLELIEAAREKGFEISCDQYPYLATGGLMGSDVLPNEFLSGKTNAQLERELRESDVREQLREIVALNIQRRGGADKQTIANYPADHSLEGKTLQEIADQNEIEPAEALFDLLADYFAGDWISEALNRDDLINFMQYPGTMISSDGVSLATSGPLAAGNPHPRNYGSCTEVMSRYVRDEKILRLEDAVRKMTSLPAAKFNLKSRGIIRVGMAADLVLFDLERIKSPDFEKPAVYPEGIEAVLVNGEFAVKDGKYQEVRAGRVI